jgi:hypothetical protein
MSLVSEATQEIAEAAGLPPVQWNVLQARGATIASGSDAAYREYIEPLMPQWILMMSDLALDADMTAEEARSGWAAINRLVDTDSGSILDDIADGLNLLTSPMEMMGQAVQHLLGIAQRMVHETTTMLTRGILRDAVVDGTLSEQDAQDDVSECYAVMQAVLKLYQSGWLDWLRRVQGVGPVKGLGFPEILTTTRVLVAAVATIAIISALVVMVYRSNTRHSYLHDLCVVNPTPPAWCFELSKEYIGSEGNDLNNLFEPLKAVAEGIATGIKIIAAVVGVGVLVWAGVHFLPKLKRASA